MSHRPNPLWQGRRSGNVDLRGTSFAVNDSFVHDGWNAAGSSTFSDNNQVADLTGGGYCGGTHPVDAPNLQLAYIGTTYSAAPVPM